MKKIFFNTFILLAVVFAIACSAKKESSEESVVDSSNWPTMDEFHMIMAESFHPFEDSANLEPARANAAEMAKLAEKWAGEPLPEKVNNEKTKANLAQLKTEAASFVQIVESGDTTQITQSLNNLHDVFHKLQEAWYSKGKEKE